MKMVAGAVIHPACFRVWWGRSPRAPAKVDAHVVWLGVACFPVFEGRPKPSLPWAVSRCGRFQSPRHLRITTAHSPSHQGMRELNPRTVSVTPYLQIDVGCWSYQRNLAALM